MSISKISNIFTNFQKDDTAAVTVDWVVLTAGIVVLGLIATFGLREALVDGAGDINTVMSSATNASP